HRHRRRDARLLDARNRHLLDDRQVAVLSIELQDVNLVALGVADVDEGGGARLRGHQRPRGHRDERGHPDPEPETMCPPHGVLLGTMSDRSAATLRRNAHAGSQAAVRISPNSRAILRQDSPASSLTYTSPNKLNATMRAASAGCVARPHMVALGRTGRGRL